MLKMYISAPNGSTCGIALLHHDRHILTYDSRFQVDIDGPGHVLAGFGLIEEGRMC